MNGRIAKIIRRKVYGEDMSTRVRDYQIRVTGKYLQQVKTTSGGIKEFIHAIYTLTAGKYRSLYQNAKKRYKRSGLMPDQTLGTTNAL
jgi:hypothetical protein